MVKVLGFSGLGFSVWLRKDHPYCLPWAPSYLRRMLVGYVTKGCI